jgi:hypothetical protein
LSVLLLVDITFGLWYVIFPSSDTRIKDGMSRLEIMDKVLLLIEYKNKMVKDKKAGDSHPD